MERLLGTDDEGNTVEVGVPLKNKGVGVSNWKIIVEPQQNGTNVTYGTGWYYVEAGKTVDGLGVLTRGYIINYDERKAVKFDGSKHTMLADGAGIAAGKDYLICNIDPSAIDTDSANFGDGVEFVGYSMDALGRPIDAFTNTSFIFDGVDDHIKIPYSSDKTLQTGFTYEFYGKINSDGNSFSYSDGEYTSIDYDRYVGMFNVHKQESQQAVVRFGARYNMFGDNKLHLLYSPLNNSRYMKGATKFQISGQNWNMHPKELYFDYGDEVYLTITFDPINEIQKVYLNGEFVDEDTFDGNLFISGIQFYEENGDFVFYDIGRCSMNSNGWWHYVDGEAYSLRLYNVGLSPTEVKANYNATVAYHNILAGGGNAGTGGATGGDDF